MNCNLMASFYFASFFRFGFDCTERFCHAKLNTDAKSVVPVAI